MATGGGEGGAELAAAPDAGRITFFRGILLTSGRRG
jgi:hypothetical protein